MSATSWFPSSICNCGVGKRAVILRSCCCSRAAFDSRFFPLPSEKLYWFHLLGGPSCRTSAVLMALPIRKQTTKKTTRKMASDATNTTMPVTLTSEVSYPAEGAPCPVGEMPCWPWGSRSGVLGVCMFWLQNLLEMRIVGLDQGPLGELVQVGDHPERDHG